MADLRPEWGGWASDMERAFAGQANGLCGAAVPGALFLSTGLHTGQVGFAVELHDERPEVGDDWGEVVEASFAPTSPEVELVEWGGEVWPLELEERSYRVRYCARGMLEAREEDTTLEGEPIIDRYLLQLWPGEPGPDVVVRESAPGWAAASLIS